LPPNLEPDLSNEPSQIADAIRACRLCVEAPHGVALPHEPRPLLRVSASARLLVASQAPGMRAHKSGVTFDDPSGDRLRQWMGVDRETFYDEAQIAIVPMGFCFPGYDANGGDILPRRECRAHWHDSLFAAMPQIETVLLVGAYSQRYHFARLGAPVDPKAKVSDVVRNWRNVFCLKPALMPLPHPSWRNTGWLKRNPWFEAEALPALRAEVARLTRPLTK